MALLSAKNHQLSFKLQGYQNKLVDINLKPGEMARQNVVLDILHEEEMKYHTQDEIGRLMNQLPVTYAGKARTYPLGETKGRSMLYVIEMSDSLENSHLKPALKV